MDDYRVICDELVDSLECAKDNLAHCEVGSKSHAMWHDLMIQLKLTLKVLSDKGHI